MKYDPIFLRWIERLLIVSGGIVFAILGYKLFMHSITKGKAEFKGDGKIGSFVFSGSVPGLLFMFCGGIILIGAIITGQQIQHAEIKPKSPPSSISFL